MPTGLARGRGEGVIYSLSTLFRRAPDWILSCPCETVWKNVRATYRTLVCTVPQITRLEDDSLHRALEDILLPQLVCYLHLYMSSFVLLRSPHQAL